MAYSKNNSASRDIRKQLSPLSISGSSSSSSSYTSIADYPSKSRRNPSPYSSDSADSTSTQDRDRERRRLQPEPLYANNSRKSSSKSGGKYLELPTVVHNKSKSVPEKFPRTDGRYYIEPGKDSSRNFEITERDRELQRRADERERAERAYPQGSYSAGSGKGKGKEKKRDVSIYY